MTRLPASLLAVHKAAVLAHWVPELSLLIRQPDWPGLQVSARPWPMGDDWWMPISPCVFRREVLGCPLRPSRILGPSLSDDDAELQIEVVTSGETRFDDTGLFTLPFDAQHSAVGFSVLAEVPIGGVIDSSSAVEVTCHWGHDETPPIGQSIDPDLGVKLVTCCFPTDDPVRAAEARQTMFDTMLATGPEEVAVVAEVLR